MRKEGDEYWYTSLPKEHEALDELDLYCREWGGLARSEATRRILIEWAKLRRGKEISAWVLRASPPLAEATAPPGTRSASGGVQRPSLSNKAAKAASRVLDE
jgi:hypothetical protein